MGRPAVKKYKIADLIVQMECRGDIILNRSRPYMIGADRPADIKIQAAYEKLSRVMEKAPHLTLGELEYIKTGFMFSSAILDYDGFCLHSSAVALDSSAVLFSAPCGTGKSTHTRLWQEYFGAEKVVIINDDKPALRLIDGIFHVYGTPWSGKSDLSSNRKVPLKAVVFIEQADCNYINPLKGRDAVQMLVYQSLRPYEDSNKIDRLLHLLDILIKNTPVYKMGCTISTEAVEMVYSKVYKQA